MKARDLVAVLVTLGWLTVPPPASAQRVAEGYHYDPPTASRLDEEGANAKLLNWVQQERGSRSADLYFRNTSDHPIEITSYQFSECTNVIGVKCGKKLTGPRLEPGETIRLETIRQRDAAQRWFYRYQFEARFIQPDGRRSSAKNEAEKETAPPRRTRGWIPERFEYVDRVLPILMRNHSVPGVAVVLVEGTTVQWSAGYGVTRAGGDEVTPRTVFRVGDLAEPVIALAVHRLSEVRAWNVESPVTTWAHEHTIPPEMEAVSAAQILAHAGPTSEASYALLQHLVEMAEGHDLDVLVRAMVLDPHRLVSMSFAPPASDDGARGHDRSGGPLAAAAVDERNVVGSLFSSATEYARFLIEVSPLSRRDPATWNRLTRPHRTLADDFGLAWGLGWIVAQAEDGSPIAFRIGTTPGFTSLAVVDETRKRALVILTNGDNGVELTEDVLAFLDPWSHPIVQAYLADPEG